MLARGDRLVFSLLPFFWITYGVGLPHLFSTLTCTLLAA